MIRLLLGILLAAGLFAKAEVHLFSNTDGTKTFVAELTGYDAESKVVTVRMKNGREMRFPIDVLGKESRAYVLDNAKRVEAGKHFTLKLERYTHPSRKVEKDRTSDRLVPSGYSITLGNRSKRDFSDITLQYTFHYAVQGYLKPDREDRTETGTLKCEKLLSKSSVTVKTKPVDIVSGKLEPIIRNEHRRTPTGEDYVVPVVVEPGGRRKDIVVGCRVEVVLDGEVVLTAVDGNLQMGEGDETEPSPFRTSRSPATE